MEAKKIETYFFLGLLLAVFALTVFILFSFITPILLGATFYVIFRPLHERIAKAMQQRRGIAAFISVCIVVLIVLTPLSLFGFTVFQEARGLYDSLVANSDTSSIGGFDSNAMLEKRLAVVREKLPPEARKLIPEIRIDLRSYAQQALGWFANNLGIIFSSLATAFFDSFLAVFTLYYLFKDGSRLRPTIVRLSPLQDDDMQQIIDKLELTINSVMKGTIVVGLIQGLIAGIGFVIFGLPNPALWGSVAAIASLLPPVGTALIVIPAAGYLMATGALWPGVGLALWGVFVVGLIDNFLRPLLIERGINIHPFLILLSVIGGVNLFGPAGFVAGPLLLSFLFALCHIYPKLITKSG